MEESEAKKALEGIRSPIVKAQLENQLASAGDEKAREETIALAKNIKSNQGLIGWKTVGLGFLFIAALLFFLAWVPQDSVLTDVSASRPVLMLIIVISTVVFGGAMINAGLFREESDGAKFQRGREIFLFFSGICATVVGFYFGAGTNEASNATPASLSTSLADDGTIIANVAGGNGPFTLKLDATGPDVMMAADQSDSSKFTLAINAEVCPAGGTFELTGANNSEVQTFPVPLTSEALIGAGWTKCGEGADPVANGNEGTGQGSAAVTPTPTPTPAET